MMDGGISPTPGELLKDRNNCFGPNMRAVWENKGACVKGLGNHNGRRAEEVVDRENEGRGGLRVKGDAPSSKPLHPDAAEARRLFLEEREAKFKEWKSRG